MQTLATVATGDEAQLDVTATRAWGIYEKNNTHNWLENDALSRLCVFFASFAPKGRVAVMLTAHKLVCALLSVIETHLIAIPGWR